MERSEHLVASHTKPWRVKENRLDGENGLLLTPTEAVDQAARLDLCFGSNARDLFITHARAAP